MDAPKELISETIVDKNSNNLQISEDTGLGDEPIAVFLYTPDISNTGEHFHPEMKVQEAKKLHDWLGRFLNKHTNGTPCKSGELRWANMQPVRCPCGCKDGVMKADGRNMTDTSTFLVCSACGCCYYADDTPVPLKA